MINRVRPPSASGDISGEATTIPMIARVLALAGRSKSVATILQSDSAEIDAKERTWELTWNI